MLPEAGGIVLSGAPDDTAADMWYPISTHASVPMEPLRIEVIDRTYAAILAAKTPAERAAMIQDCHRTARIVLATGERLRHPEWSDDQVATAVAQRLPHGTD